MPGSIALAATASKEAGKQVAVYLGVSALLFLADTCIYTVAFLISKPKYTFLFGNSLLAAVILCECLLAFYVTCIRSRSAAAVQSLRFRVSCIVTAVLLLYGLHATVFSIVERSVSMNVLRFLASGRPEGYDRIEQNFVATYVDRDRAVCKRLDEQVHLGNVAVENGSYVITKKGIRTAAVLEYAERITAGRAPKNAVSCR